MYPILAATSVSKRYDNKLAVNQFDLTLAKGQCIGLLGPNGAGKSTVMEMLEGVITPDSGEIHFNGEPINREYRNRIGIQFQQTALPDYLTVRECLKLFASFYRTSLPLDYLIELCQLTEFADRLHFHLSGGERQRLLLAMSLVNNPDLVFLDEPTTGLDPAARQAFWRTVKQLKQQGKTLLLTTHYMEEASQLCDWITMMDRGNIILSGEPQSLLGAHFKAHIASYQGSSHLPDELITNFDAHPQEPGWQLYCNDTNDLFQALQQWQLPISQLSLRPPNLEDLFIKFAREGQ